MSKSDTRQESPTPAMLGDWDEQAWQANAEAVATVFSSEDAKEGPTAFAQKRAPVWTGR